MAKSIQKTLTVVSLYTVLLILGSLYLSSAVDAKMKPCEMAYINQFLNEPLHKAFATTGARAPSNTKVGLSCGWATGQDSKELAIQVALAKCRGSDKKWNDPGSCKIYSAK
jgi:hypothetical protein